MSPQDGVDRAAGGLVLVKGDKVAVVEILEAGGCESVEARADLAGIDRVVLGRFPDAAAE